MRRSLIALLACWATAPAAGADRAEELLAGLDALQARFVQEVRDPDGRVLEASAGSFAMQEPDLFRWQYETPYQQLIVADGSQVWLYDVDLEQVTVRAQAEAAESSPLSVLTRPGTLTARYRVSYPDAGEGIDLVRLEPLVEGADFERVTLRFVAGQLDRLDIDDALGQQTSIRFETVVVNPRLGPELFRFEPPPGVDVLGMEALLGPEPGP